MPKITLITGGARSGKSTHALALAREYQGRRAFLATAEACDEEMRERIQKHREQRDESFLTIEEPLDLAGALRSLPGDVDIAVVDCLTVWLANLMHYRRSTPEARGFDTTLHKTAGHSTAAGRDESGYPRELADLLALLDAPPCDLVLVTNEVGMGIVPTETLARRFRDLAGWTSQHIAKRADRVILMISGIPIIVK